MDNSTLPPLPLIAVLEVLIRSNVGVTVIYVKLVENDGNYLEKPARVNPISQLFPNRKSQPVEHNDVEDMNGTQGGNKEGDTF